MNDQSVLEVMLLIGIIFLILTALPALTMVQEVLSPALLEQSRGRLSRGIRRSFVAGLFNGTFFLFLAMVMASTNIFVLALPGVLLLGGLILLSIIGVGAIAGLVGNRVFELWERPTSAGARLLMGSILLEALILIPIFGWLLLSVLGLSGLGAVLMTLWHRWRRSKQPEET